MGLSTAGLIFKSTSSMPDEAEMIRRAFGDSFRPVPASDVQRGLDIRLPGNVAVESMNGAIGIYSSEAAGQVIFEGKVFEPSFLSALGNPDIILVFCHYDSSGTFAYGVFENGVRTRFRLHTDETTNDQGVPMDIELPWLQAEPFVEEDDEDGQLVYRNKVTGEVSNEYYLTARLLKLVVTELFGVCPWDEWNYKTKFNYYHSPIVG